jgi:AcrR family transcriptional regulator
MAGLREEKKQETRTRIIEAAWKLFTGKGYAQTTIGAIAREARVGTGTVYNYFPSKEHVLAAHFSQQFAPVLKRIDATLRTGDPYTDVMTIIEAMWPYMFQEPELMREAMSVFFSAEDINKAVGNDLTAELIRDDIEILGRLQLILEKGKATGKIADPIDTQLAALTIYSTLVTTWTGYIFGTFTSAEDARQLQRGMIAMIFNGLKGDRT